MFVTTGEIKHPTGVQMVSISARLHAVIPICGGQSGVGVLIPI